MTSIEHVRTDQGSSAHAARDERVAHAVAATMDRHHVPGLSLAITTSDRVLYSGGFGQADLATHAAATPSTQYLWFSLTKIATATVVMQLVDRGDLDLHRPVSDILDCFQPTGRRSPTVWHLLNHTAGLANPIPVRWVRPAAAPAPEPREFLEQLLQRYGTSKYPMDGTARYSNLGYLLLAEVVAATTGRPFTEVVTRDLLEPLGMHHTGFNAPDPAHAAVGYVRVPRVAVHALRLVLPRGVVGPRAGHFTSLHPFLVNGPGYGGLVGDVSDASRLAAVHLGDGVLDGVRILHPETARAMRTITAKGTPFDLGLGWFRKPAARGTMAVEHLGAGGGFFNAMRIYPDLGLGIVAMANTTTAWDNATLFDTLAHLDWD